MQLFLALLFRLDMLYNYNYFLKYSFIAVIFVIFVVYIQQ